MLIASLAGLAGAACLAMPALAGGARNHQTAKLQRALDRVVAAGAPGAAVLVRDGDRTTRLRAATATSRRRRRCGSPTAGASAA